MASFNKVILMGNLVEDPDLRQTPSGVPVTNFRIAVSRRFRKDGEQDADFISIVCWRSTAEFVTKYFEKGRSILVCGQLQQRSWEDKDGNKRSTLEVVADEVSFVDKKPDSAAAQTTPTTTSGPYSSSSYSASNYSVEDFTPDDDCPF